MAIIFLILCKIFIERLGCWIKSIRISLESITQATNICWSFKIIYLDALFRVNIVVLSDT